MKILLWQPLVKFKSHLYYEDKDRVSETMKNLTPVPGSKIIFFKNGEPQGEAFVDIYHGAYYPAISVFKNATVSVNFGPTATFKYPEIEEQYQCRAVSSWYHQFKQKMEIDSKIYHLFQMHDRVEDLICEQSLADMMYFTENDGKLRLDNFSLWD